MRVRNKYTADSAAAELKRLLDNPSYTEKAAEVGRRVQAENGVCIACDAIEEQLNQAA
jgi:UDP:flavonoid glycosyltransferase YjiC (YdhE family)